MLKWALFLIAFPKLRETVCSIFPIRGFRMMFPEGPMTKMESSVALVSLEVNESLVSRAGLATPPQIVVAKEVNGMIRSE